MNLAELVSTAVRQANGNAEKLMQVILGNNELRSAAIRLSAADSLLLSIQLRELGVTARDADAFARAIRAEARDAEAEDDRRNQAERLLDLAADLDLFHDADRTPYADITTQGDEESHRETHPVNGSEFRHWLRGRFLDTYDTVPNRDAVNEAIEQLSGMAVLRGPCRQVHVRVAEHEGEVYLDLADDHWRVVRITNSGWTVTTAPPVRFVRPKGMRPLPEPRQVTPVTAQRNLALLWSYINVPEERRPLVLGCLLDAFRPKGPHVITALFGEHGGGKSTCARVLKALTDPATAPLLTAPRSEHDLAINCQNARVLVFDNLSFVQEWLADAFCRVATGGGFRTRKLYTDSDEVIFDFCRPMVTTGIPELSSRADLADRCVFIGLSEIKDCDRVEESAFWRSFEQDQPRILGAICHAVSVALCRLPEVKLRLVPRMADFARWVSAAEPALDLDDGQFIKAYEQNRQETAGLVLEGSLIAAPVVSFTRTHGHWSGTAGELLEQLDLEVGEEIRRRRAWPKSAQKLGTDLRRLKAPLEAAGVNIEFHRSGKSRTITLMDLNPAGSKEPSPPSQPSAQEQHQPGDAGDGGDSESSPGPGSDALAERPVRRVPRRRGPEPASMKSQGEGDGSVRARR